MSGDEKECSRLMIKTHAQKRKRNRFTKVSLAAIALTSSSMGPMVQSPEARVLTAEKMAEMSGSEFR